MTLTTLISARTGTFFSFGPVAKALIVGALFSILIQKISLDDAFNSSAIFSGAFNLLAIFSGFLGTFYVFIATRSNKFLEAIRNTVTFRKMVGLIKFTIYWTLITVAFSYMLMIFEPTKYDLFSFQHFTVASWTWALLMIAINFARCVSMFISIVEQSDT